MRRTTRSFAVLLFAVSCGFASIGDSTLSIRHHGFVSFEIGQIVAGQWKQEAIDHVWKNRLLGGYSLTAHAGPHLSVNVSMECLLAFPVLSENSNYATDPETYHGQFMWYPDRLDGEYSIGDPSRGLTITIGYFPFSYNSDARNLGEYLFRGHCYPGYMINDFDAVYKRVLGMDIQARLFGALRQDFIVTSSVIDNPVQDFDLSYLAAAQLGPMLNIGAGISLEHFLSVNEQLTTPEVNQNMFIDTAAGDTGYYTFRGIKIMGRLSFDPKQLFNAGILGSEDLKVYAEACILGLQDQGNIYTDIMRRIPLAIGFNVPAFKLLDVCAVEVELYRSQYSNNYQRTFLLPTSLPLPVDDPAEPRKSDWYWSAYVKRTLTKGWSLIGQVAHDHIFTYSHGQFFQDRREALPNNGDWHWVVKTQFNF